MDPCPDGAQQCCAPATEWRRRKKPTATNAKQKSTASNRMKMAGSTRRYKGKTEEHSQQQNEDDGINPPLQRQDRRARRSPGFARDRRMAVPQKPKPAGEERFIARKPREGQLFFEVVA